MNRRRFLKISAIQTVSLLGAGSLLSGMSESVSERLITWEGILFGSRVVLHLVHEDAARGRDILRQCIRKIKTLESQFTLYEENSCLNQLNRHGRIEHGPQEFIQLAREAVKFGDLTDGLFDVTVKPLQDYIRDSCSTFSGKGREMEIIPENLYNSQGFQHALDLVDYRKIVFEGDAIRFSVKGMKMTLNGIAQGYMTDVACDFLRNQGIQHTLVDLGENRALGNHPDNRPWNISILTNGMGDGSRVNFELSDRALACSAGYGEKYTQSGNFNHLINPITGICQNEFACFIVDAPNATVADVLSTALGACPPDGYNRLLDRFSGTIRAYGADRQGNITRLGNC